MSDLSVGIIYKRNYEIAKFEAQKLEDWFNKNKIAVFSEEMNPSEVLNECQEGASNIPKTVNWVIVLGGDGTLLGAARWVVPYGIPILGVNLGGLGFLTSVPLERLYSVIEKMIHGNLELESRIMLEIKVMREDRNVCDFQVLNDVVINKAALARIIDLDVSIDNVFLTTFRADGLIISSPTGSTAYNLSAGGPIMYPTIETLVLTPICPFTLTNRPIIIPDSSTIKVTMGKESEEKVLLTFDGQVGFDFYHGDTLFISKSDFKISLLKPADHNYFELLRTKLKWGGTTHNKHGDF
jgi:NAD+ kinase